MYTSMIIDNPEHCMEVMKKMEEAYAIRDESYFIKVLEEERSLVLRVHAVCILAEIGGEDSVQLLCDLLLKDPDPLVRHEAAFALGQIGLSSANEALKSAMLNDNEAIVRHEAAAALGAIGSPSSEQALRLALEDKDEIVRNSAHTSLFNIMFLKTYQQGSTKEMAPRP